LSMYGSLQEQSVAPLKGAPERWASGAGRGRDAGLPLPPSALEPVPPPTPPDGVGLHTISALVARPSLGRHPPTPPGEALRSEPSLGRRRQRYLLTHYSRLHCRHPHPRLRLHYHLHYHRRMRTHHPRMRMRTHHHPQTCLPYRYGTSGDGGETIRRGSRLL